MADWDKLNKELDSILENITDNEWNDWIEDISKQKEIEKMQMLLDANLQSEKLLFEKLIGKTIINQTLNSDNIINISNLTFKKDYTDIEKYKPKENNYSLAA